MATGSKYPVSTGLAGREEQPAGSPLITEAPKPIPTLMETINVAGATVPKNSRARDGSTNQDSVDSLVHESSDLMVAAVFDGCGSHKKSHIGANIGGLALLRTIYDSAVQLTINTKGSLSHLDFKQIQTEWGAKIRDICEDIGGNDWADHMQENFQFTAVGIIMTPTETLTWHCGDGYIVLNGKKTQLERENGNEPNYPIYPFVDGIASTVQDKSWIKADPVIETSSVQSIILATDGAEYLPDGVESMTGYQDTATLQQYLQQLQAPRLEMKEDEPVVTPTIRKEKPFISASRVASKISGSVTFSTNVSASLNWGLAADDIAIVVIVQKGHIAKQVGPSNPAAKDDSTLGSVLKSLWSKGQRR